MINEHNINNYFENNLEKEFLEDNNIVSSYNSNASGSSNNSIISNNIFNTNSSLFKNNLSLDKEILSNESESSEEEELSNKDNKLDNILDNSNIYTQEYKIILIGNTNAGKTSFINKLMNIGGITNTTIGVDCHSKKLKYKDNIIIQSMIWDTAGQERYNSIISSYYRHSDGILLFFDLNNSNSYEDIRYWLNEIIYFVKKGLIYIIGNKNDLEIKVNKYDILKFIQNEYKNYNIYYKEVSIKNNIPDVEDIYSEFLINLYRIYNKKKVTYNNTTIRIKNKLKKKKKCCIY